MTPKLKAVLFDIDEIRREIAVDEAGKERSYQLPAPSFQPRRGAGGVTKIGGFGKVVIR